MTGCTGPESGGGGRRRRTREMVQNGIPKGRAKGSTGAKEGSMKKTSGQHRRDRVSLDWLEKKRQLVNRMIAAECFLHIIVDLRTSTRTTRDSWRCVEDE